MTLSADLPRELSYPTYYDTQIKMCRSLIDFGM